MSLLGASCKRGVRETLAALLRSLSSESRIIASSTLALRDCLPEGATEKVVSGSLSAAEAGELLYRNCSQGGHILKEARARAGLRDQCIGHRFEALGNDPVVLKMQQFPGLII